MDEPGAHADLQIDLFIGVATRKSPDGQDVTAGGPEQAGDSEGATHVVSVTLSHLERE